MPIDLKDYTPLYRRHLRKVGACAVYIIGGKEKGPLKIGLAGDVWARLKGLQAGTLLDLNVYHILWTPGRPVATRVEGYSHGLLRRAGRSIKDEWFNVDAGSAIHTVNWAARELYPSANLFTHEQVMGHLAKRYPPRPARPKKEVDELQQIRENECLAEMFGTASSDPAAFQPTPIDVALVMEDDLERRLDPEGYNARVRAESERIMAARKLFPQA